MISRLPFLMIFLHFLLIVLDCILWFQFDRLAHIMDIRFDHDMLSMHRIADLWSQIVVQTIMLDHVDTPDDYRAVQEQHEYFQLPKSIVFMKRKKQKLITCNLIECTCLFLPIFMPNFTNPML